MLRRSDGKSPHRSEPAATRLRCLARPRLAPPLLLEPPLVGACGVCRVWDGGRLAAAHVKGGVHRTGRVDYDLLVRVTADKGTVNTNCL